MKKTFIKRIVSVIFAAVMCSLLWLPSYAITNTTESLESDSISPQLQALCDDYITAYMEVVVDHPSTIYNRIQLIDPYTNQVKYILYVFELGYAIIDIVDFYVCEYSVCSSNPYLVSLESQQLYYIAPLGYYCLENGNYRHILSNELISISSQAVPTTLLDINSMCQKINNLKSPSSTYSIAATIETERYLSSSLATDWVNGYCGPTSAYNMLKYRGLVESGYTGQQLIYRISSYTGSSVDLTSLTNGINLYLSYAGFSNKVASTSYSFNKVMTEINANRPLTLGTNGGGLASGGHVQTIHGYYKYSIGTSITYYTLYVNNSWGQNGVAITYETTTPSYLKDHVYYLN